MWDSVPAIDRNGDITRYEVRYRIHGMDTADSVQLLNAFTLSTVLTELEEYMNYAITVSAHTAEGSGPFSLQVVATTLEDGNIFKYIAYINAWICMNNNIITSVFYLYFLHNMWLSASGIIPM